MTSDKLLVIKNRINMALAKSRLNAAFDELQAMAAAISAPWSVRDEISHLRSGYDYLVHYALDGATDPTRPALLADIVSGIKRHLDGLIRLNDKKDSSRLYFSTLRYEEMQSDSTLSQLLARYVKNADIVNLALLSGGGDVKSDDGEPMEVSQEKLARRMFDVVWVTHPLSSDDEEALGRIFKSDILPAYVKQLMLSAVMLGALEYYDERRLVVLADAYMSADADISIMALCALMLAMWVNRASRSGKRLSDRLAAMAERQGWADDVKMAFLQFIRTRDTERINRTMKNEIFPEMMKLRPDVYKKIRDVESMESLTETDYNPEWEELLANSGLADKIKEISELQADGGDVMMSTFAHLKTFPFFTYVANWFLPFYVEHSEVATAINSEMSGMLNEIVNASPFLCNSDKYSMALSMSSVPEAHRRMLSEQLRAQNINIAELRNSDIYSGAKHRENVANKYIQDVYRFFKLFRRKGEFHDPFTSPINVIELPQFAPFLNDDATLNLVSEFYFKRGYYRDALAIYRILLDRMPSSVQILQKTAYCLQKEGELSEALALYERAEMLAPDSLWTLRRIALCHKLMNDPAKALQYFERIAAKCPDDLGVVLNIGHSLMELGRYDEALKQYFKVEFLDEKSSRAWRPIAWCAFLADDYDRSRQYFERILSSGPDATDYLNFANLEMATGHYQDAVRLYARSLVSDSGGRRAFENAIDADKHYLFDKGVDPILLDIVIDEACRHAAV